MPHPAIEATTDEPVTEIARPDFAVEPTTPVGLVPRELRVAFLFIVKNDGNLAAAQLVQPLFDIKVELLGQRDARNRCECTAVVQGLEDGRRFEFALPYNGEYWIVPLELLTVGAEGPWNVKPWTLSFLRPLMRSQVNEVPEAVQVRNQDREAPGPHPFSILLAHNPPAAILGVRSGLGPRLISTYIEPRAQERL